jgi:hypothetical protein
MMPERTRQWESVFFILEFQAPLVSYVVYAEGLVGNIRLERRADLEISPRILPSSYYALNPADSADLITKVPTSYICRKRAESARCPQ